MIAMFIGLSRLVCIRTARSVMKLLLSDKTATKA